MSRRLVLFLVLPLFLLLVLAGGVYLLRLEIATAVLKSELAARGADGPQLQVTELTLASATVEKIRLGEAGEIRIGRLGLKYDWRELGAGRLDDIAIDDAVIQLDFTGESPPLGSLQDLIASVTPEGQQDDGDGSDEVASATPIPPITFTGGRIEAKTPEGPIVLDASGLVELGESGRMTVTAQVEGEGPPGRAQGQLEAELIDGRPTRLVADLTLTGFALPQVTAESAQLHLDFSERSLAIDLDLQTAEGSALLSLYGESGRPMMDLLPELTEEVSFARLTALDLTGQGALSLSGFTLPGTVDAADADLVFDLALGDGSAKLFLPDPATLSAQAIDSSLLAESGLPDALRTALAGPAELRVSALEAGQPALTLAEEDAGYRISSALSLALEADTGARLAGSFPGWIALSEKGHVTEARLKTEDLEITQLSVDELAVQGASYRGKLTYADAVARAEGTLTVTGLEVQGSRVDTASYAGTARYEAGRYSAEGRLAASAAEVSAGGFRLEKAVLDLPVDLQGSSTEARLQWQERAELLLGGLGDLPLKTADGGLALASERGALGFSWRDGFSIEHDLTLSLDLGDGEIAGVPTRSTPVTLDLEGGTGEDGSYRIAATGSADAITLPGYSLRASGLSLDGEIEGSEGKIRLRIARLADLGDPQIYPPVAVTVDATPTDSGFLLSVYASGAGDRLKANATVRLDTETGTGSASFKLAPLLFVPGSLQPADVLPLLSGLTEVQAEMRSEGKLAWNGRGLTGSGGQIRLDNASMTTGAGRVEKLTTAIELTSLWPPVSEPGQKLTAQSYETNGVTFTDLEATYRVVEGEGDFPDSLPLLLIEHAEMRFGRGLFEVSEVLIDPLSDRQVATVDVEGLELKDLFDLADIEDVTGEGPMSGSVPIRIQGGDIVIEDGHLESTGPGVFKIRSAEAKAALQGAGDYVDLVLQALENFQYERLSIELDKPADGNSVLQLKVLGSNPEVLDGHPFDINLNLETDLAPLLEALGAGQRLSEDLMERIRKQRQGRQNDQE